MPVRVIGMIGVAPPSGDATVHIIKGGISAHYLAAYAQAHDTLASNHCFTEMSFALLATQPNVQWLEYMHWLEPIYKERIELDGNGHALLPTRPGWGFSFDPDAVKKYAV